MKRTALKPGLKGLRRTGMPPRTKRLKRVPFVSKPAKYKPGKGRAQKVVRKRSKLRCEIGIQAICWGEGTEFSHRVRDGQGGRWAASNGLRACRPCHDWIDGNFYSARAKGWVLGSTEDPTLEPAVRFGVWVLLGDNGSVTPTDPPVRAVA